MAATLKYWNGSAWVAKPFKYWTGSAWEPVPNGIVRNNDLVWRTVTFPALTTNRIRVLVEWGNDGWGRLTEVEAYQAQ